MTMGDNAFGQLGSNDPDDDEVLLYANEFSSPPEEMSAGVGFSVVRCRDLSVYTFGLNNRGQLGRPTPEENRGEEGSEYDPQPVSIMEALFVKSGDFHTVGVDESSTPGVFNILAFGDNSLLQVDSNLPPTRALPPRAIFQVPAGNLVAATAGGSWTGVLTNTQLLVRGGGLLDRIVNYVNGRALALGKSFGVVIGDSIHTFNPNTMQNRLLVDLSVLYRRELGVELPGQRGSIINLVVGINNFAFTAKGNGVSASFVCNAPTNRWKKLPVAIDLSFRQDDLVLVDTQGQIQNVAFDSTGFTANRILHPYPGPVRSIAQGGDHQLVLVD